VLDHRNNLDQSSTVVASEASLTPYVMHRKCKQGQHWTGDRQLSCDELVAETPSQPPDLVSTNCTDNLLIKYKEFVSLPNGDLVCAKDEVSLDKRFSHSDVYENMPNIVNKAVNMWIVLFLTWFVAPICFVIMCYERARVAAPGVGLVSAVG